LIYLDWKGAIVSEVIHDKTSFIHNVFSIYLPFAIYFYNILLISIIRHGKELFYLPYYLPFAIIPLTVDYGK